MKALWLENKKLRFRNDLPVPEPSPGEALVKILAAGICGTDLELVKGYYPFTGIPGHEFIGVVMKAPDGPDFEGKRVVGDINISCGQCRECMAGRSPHCEQRSVLGIRNRNGAFAQFTCLPIKNLFTVPSSIPDEAAVFVEPVAAAIRMLEQVSISPSNRVLVLGAGRLGQIEAQVLSSTGCDLQVAARYAGQRATLETRRINWIDENGIADRSFDVVVEATGTPGGFEAALKAVRPRGTIVLKSTFKGMQQVSFSSVVVDEITLIGSRCGPFAPAIRMIESGRVEPVPLIEKRFLLEDAEKAFQTASRTGTLKVIFKIS